MMRTRVSFETGERIEQLYRKGWSTPKIAREVGRTAATVRDVLIRRNVPLRSPGAPRGAHHGNWKGGKSLRTSSGYVLRAIPHDHPFACMTRRSKGKRRSYLVFEHRLRMAEYLGRPLRPDETVHHLNGIRDDNRIENLQLRYGAHGPGMALVCHQCGSHDIGPDRLEEQSRSQDPF